MATATKFIKWLRTNLAGRVNWENDYLRYANTQKSRTVPPPQLPEGVTHKLSANYYYTRDGRRAKQPPELVAAYRHTALPDPKFKHTSVAQLSAPTPGDPLVWELTEENPFPYGTGYSDVTFYHKEDELKIHLKAPREKLLTGN